MNGPTGTAARSWATTLVAVLACGCAGNPGRPLTTRIIPHAPAPLQQPLATPSTAAAPQVTTAATSPSQSPTASATSPGSPGQAVGRRTAARTSPERDSAVRLAGGEQPRQAAAAAANRVVQASQTSGEGAVPASPATPRPLSDDLGPNPTRGLTPGGSSTTSSPTTDLDPPQSTELRYVPTLPEDEGMPDNQTEDDLPLSAVIDSVYRAYPLLEAAIRQRDVAAGEQLQAAGAFDLKLSAGSENQPLGFYETYRQNIKLLQPLYSGGEAFAAYRVGRGGLYEPWYLERQTNDGGEFKAGLSLPFSRNRVIDERRANVWKTTYGRQQVEFEIQAELIDFVQHAGYAYWDWVAAGERYRIATSILELARERNQGIERQVELGDKDPPVLQDNRRLIVSREAKQIEAGRKLQETAVKLSIYYRDELGRPVIPAPEQLPEFPNPTAFNAGQLDSDVQQAVERRPELRVLSLLQRQLEVDYAQAHNDFRPALDGFVTGAQDMGAPTSKKMDKSQFELETGVVMEVSAQRRKARGKMGAVQAKLAQVNAKRRLTQDKIVAEVQRTYAALVAARERVTRAREARQLADQMAAIERRRFELGDSDLLAVNLREQQSAEAADVLIDTLLEAFRAEVDYRAALALDEIPPGP